EYGRKVPELSPVVIDIFMTYDWPGNIRELENIVGRSIINMSRNEAMIMPKHIPPLTRNAKPQWLDEVNVIKDPEAETPEAEALPAQTLSKLLDSTEKDILQSTLLMTKGNKTKAAKQLGIAVRSLYYKLEKHGLL
ncbi:MAG: helix-turn-helix domain-containing protein, partial [Desulfotomaculaceae bacterium]|nr:helix-turn-helix domain-containing protein [Desulfotomaculaceae bacterium]